MNKKTVKVLFTVITFIMVFSVAFSVFALTPKGLTGTDPQGTEIQDFGNKIIGVIQTVGIVVSVIILLVLGIKYMLGSAEEKAEYKKTMMPYLIGAVLIFAASTIANIVYQFFKS